MAKTAVVILNYNGVEYLKQFLPGVVQHSPTADVIVVDNCSTDESIEFLRSQPKVELIVLDKNYGFTGGYNKVMKTLEYEYCVLLNSDVEVTEGWLDSMTEKLDNSPEVVACQPKILAYHERDHFEYAGAAGGFIDKLGFPYCRGRIFETLEEDRGQYDQDLEIFWTTGACMIVRTEEFNRAGGFDEDFFAHMEEIDLCWRFHHMGKKLYCLSQSVVYHVGGGTLAKTNPKKTYLNFRNNLSMIFKNESAAGLLWKLPLKLSLDWAAAIKFGLDNSFSHFTAVLRAHFYFFTHIPSLLKKRKRSRHLRSDTPATRITGMIVYDYFVKGRKVYSDLK